MVNEIRVLSAGTVASFFSELEKDLERDGEQSRKSCQRCGNEVPLTRDLCELCEKNERNDYFDIY
jgi:predicted amidophosphoribosyltransferase